jgi:predicted transcriptional regulator
MMTYDTRDEMEGRLNALHQLLRNTDYKAIKHSEGLIADDAYAETKTQRQAWRAEINELEEKLAETQ